MKLFDCKAYPAKHLLVFLNLIMLLFIVFFGLFYKAHSLNNNVAWLENQNGIHFGNYGIAYTHTAFPAGSYRYKQKGISFEMVLRPETSNNDRFRVLLTVHGGQDSQQLLMGQWRSALIVMNGDDYDGRLGVPKIGIADALSPHQDTFISITSGVDGTRVYINGRLEGHNPRLVLKVPNNDSDAVVVVGNSPYGRHSWTGSIYGLAIYDEALYNEAAAFHHDQWSASGTFSFCRKIQPKVLYVFNDKSGDRAFDHSRNGHHLSIPSRVEILKKEILVAPWNESRLDRHLMKDMVFNLAGFIPFGFLCTALLVICWNRTSKEALIWVFCICFSISLAIELIQVWIPSRSSQSLDLIMNTAGGLVGAVFYGLKPFSVLKR